MDYFFLDGCVIGFGSDGVDLSAYFLGNEAELGAYCLGTVHHFFEIGQVLG